jgi:Bacterial Ig-like domain (group 3)
MKGPTFKWPSTGRLRRTALVLGVVGATTGGLLFTAAAAQAVTGSGPGQLTFSPASGPSTTSPTWSTSTPCPANFNTSAVLFVLNTDGTIGSSASATVPSVTAPFSGGLLNTASIASIVSLGSNVSTSGGTATFVVGCFSGAGGLGNVTYVQTTQIQFSANGSTYGPVVAATATTTALGLSTTTPAPGATVTLTATVTPASGTTVPTGSVQFTAGGTNIGTPVTLSATGVATTTTVAPATAGTVVPVSAVFTPTGTGFSGSTGNSSFTVVGSNGPFPIPVTFTVGATGAFTFTANTNAVTLTVDAANTTGTGNLNGNAITVTDTRNTFPGWSVTGQESNFTVPAPGTASISGNQLGWTPTSTGTLPAGVILGGTVAPASPGLGTTAAVLAQEHSGSNTGTSSANLSANLLLAIPAAQPAGTYSGTLTLTAVQSLP